MSVDKNNWESISANQLAEMTDDERSNLLSVCWHEGKFRCETVGISDLNLDQHFFSGNSYFRLAWSDRNGDPHIFVKDMDKKIDNVGDGDWNYGLYKRKN